MTPQSKPNRWSCIPTAFAMALDIPVDEFIRAIGHDGGEVICPDLAEPAGRRGFHEQECVTAALARGFACTPIEFTPASLFLNKRLRPIEFPAGATNFGGNRDRFAHHVNTARGVLTGMGGRTRHAVAFDHGLICNPDTGSMYCFSFEDCESRGFYANTLWRVDRIAE
jgi:hypothetical protein